MLKRIPCRFAIVAEDGRIVCSKCNAPENGISPLHCVACPARQVNCQWLRFSLVKQTRPSLTINGRKERWSPDSKVVTFQYASCAFYGVPVNLGTCMRCPLRSENESFDFGDFSALKREVTRMGVDLAERGMEKNDE